MRAILAAALCLMLCVSFCSAEVKVLTKRNFEDEIKQSELSLVKFFAPWCGHCQKLAPEFEKASALLAGKALLAEVDCASDDNKELCGQFSISGYPTLIFFRKGVEDGHYSGSRTANGIVEYIESQVGSAVKTISSEKELQTFLDSGKAVAFLVASNENSPVLQTISNLAPKYRLHMTFVVTTDQTVMPDLPVDTVAVLRKKDREIFLAEGDEKLEKFLSVARLPFVGEISPETVSLYAEFFNDKMGGLPSGWLMLSKADDQLIAQLDKVASERRDRIVLLWADTTKYSGVARHIGLPEDASFPAFAVQMNERHYIFPQSDEVTADALGIFIDRVLNGEVEALHRSEPIPQEETVKGLTTLVGDSLVNYLHHKEMLILFHAPWCGHCKKFKPIYAEFAEEMEAKPLMVAEMDATKNDYDRSLFPVEGFPTVYYVPLKGAPVEFNGERTAADLKAFIQKQANDDSEGDL